MKIIDKNDCYVSKDDLLHLFDNDECMPISLQQSLRDALVNGKDYIKIDDYLAEEYIYSSNIPSFDSLAKLSINELRKEILKIIIDDTFNDYEEEGLSLNELIRIKNNREYMLKQLKEMIAFKKGKSEITYPDIPYPYLEQITSGDYTARLSYNPDRIIIYNINGQKVENVDDIKFCLSAYKSLTRDLDSEDLDMKYDGNYFVVKNKEKKLVRNRIVD